MTVACVVRLGAARILLGIADAPSGFHYGGTPGSSNYTCCAWGPRRQHFGADDSLYQ